MTNLSALKYATWAVALLLVSIFAVNAAMVGPRRALLDMARAQVPAGISSKTITNAAVSSLVLKASGGLFYGGQVNTGASALWVMLIDATADAGNGAVAGCGTGVHAAGCVVKWWQVSANSTIGLQVGPPLIMTNGAVLVCSTTGPFTETQSATCEFSGEVQ